MSALDFSAGLLVMARKDFNALRGMIDNPLFADEIFGFHVQQAIEKSLKAWLAARSVIFPLTHDLSRLLDLLEENGADVNLFWSLVQYTVFAVQARYETGLVETETPIDRVAVIEAVQQLLDTVLAETGLNVAQVRNHRI
jgi:HEPN domain-containing protein